MNNDIDKMIYISIPKTGTNTVHKLRGHREFNHTKAKTILKKVGDENYFSRGAFCFIRNPFDLVKSWYAYHKKNNRVPENEGKYFYPDSIDDWIIKYKFKTHWQRLRFKIKNPFWDLSNPLFQKEWILDFNNNCIVNKIYCFDDFSLVLNDLYGEEINVMNRSCASKIRLSRQSKAIIEEVFSDDLELYFSLK